MYWIHEWGLRGKRKCEGTSAGSVFAGRHALLNSPIFYVVYYILNSGGFMRQTIADGVPRPSRPWTDTYSVEVSTTDDLFHTLKTMWGPASLRSVTDSTEQWSPQEDVTMFGYIEGSFLVNRTGDACERHVPNIHRVRLYVI